MSQSRPRKRFHVCSRICAGTTWSIQHVTVLHPKLWSSSQVSCIFLTNFHLQQTQGYAVAQLVEALRYKPEGRGFVHWNFSLTKSFRLQCGPGVDSASDRNEYQEYFLGGRGGRCVRLTTLPLSCADCLEIWEPKPPGTLRACPGLFRDCFTFNFTYSRLIRKYNTRLHFVL